MVSQFSFIKTTIFQLIILMDVKFGYLQDKSHWPRSGDFWPPGKGAGMLTATKHTEECLRSTGAIIAMNSRLGSGQTPGRNTMEETLCFVISHIAVSHLGHGRQTRGH